MNKNINILGIYANSDFASYDLYNKTCPLGLLTLLHSYPDKAIIYNEQISGSVLENEDLINSSEFVFLSVNVANINRSLELALFFKNISKHVFLGGPEISMIGPSLLKSHSYLDGIVTGTGESVIEDIFNNNDSSGRVFFSKNIKDYEHLFSNYKPVNCNLNFSSIRISYDMLYDYHKYSGISYLWGNDCSQAKKRCYFCGRTSMGIGYRDSKVVWQEILEQYKKGIKFFYNTTDSVTTRLESFVDFCNNKPNEIKDDAVHRVFVNAHQVNKVLIESLKKINGIAVLGIESFSNINGAGKVGATETSSLSAINQLYDAGVKFVISFVYGLPNDTPDTLDYNSEIIKDLVFKYNSGIESVHISPLLITTGSNAYYDLFEKEQIKNKYINKKLPYNSIELSEDYFRLFCNISRKATIDKIIDLHSFIYSIYPHINFYAKGILKSELINSNILTNSTKEFKKSPINEISKN